MSMLSVTGIVLICSRVHPSLPLSKGVWGRLEDVDRYACDFLPDMAVFVVVIYFSTMHLSGL